MNIEKLYKNLIFNNYKELCEVLGIKYTTGNAKKIQLDNLKQYCNYKKNKCKFVITEIYTTPKMKVDKRISGNRTMYLPYSETVLLDIVSKNNNTFECTLMELINIVANERLIKVLDSFKNDPNNVVIKSIKRNFQCLLNNLKRRRIIEFEKIRNEHDRRIFNYVITINKSYKKTDRQILVAKNQFSVKVLQRIMKLKK